MATTATTQGVHVDQPTIARTTAATSSFTLSESADAPTRTTPLEGQVTAEREHVIADVKETQAAQFDAVDNLSHKLENTQAATEGLFTRDLPAQVGTETQSDPGLGMGVGVGTTSTSSNTITVPAAGLSSGLPAGVTLVQTVAIADTTNPVAPA